MNEKKYYEQNDVVEFEFIKVPKYIFKSEKFKSLSSSAKVSKSSRVFEVCQDKIV